MCVFNLKLIIKILNEAMFRHVLYVKGINSSTSDPQSESVEVDYVCSATNPIGTEMAETSILLRSKLTNYYITRK